MVNKSYTVKTTKLSLRLYITEVQSIVLCEGALCMRDAYVHHQLLGMHHARNIKVVLVPFSKQHNFVLKGSICFNKSYQVARLF